MNSLKRKKNINMNYRMIKKKKSLNDLISSAYDSVLLFDTPTIWFKWNLVGTNFREIIVWFTCIGSR